MNALAQQVLPDARFALGTFSIAGGAPFAGLAVGGEVIAAAALNRFPALIGGKLRGGDTMFGLLEDWAENLPLLRRAAESFDKPAGAPARAIAAPIASLKIHAPVENPRQILMAGGNYRRHVIEMMSAMNMGQGDTPDARREWLTAMIDAFSKEGDAFVWSKLFTAVTGPYDDIVIPRTTKKLDWELELVAVIGKPSRNVSRQDALSHVAGYCIANDVSARDLIPRTDFFKGSSDWTAGKCAPGFMPMGPLMVPAEFVPDPNSLRLALRHNGKLMQDESTEDMIHDVARLIEWTSRHVQLLPGDLISTGSPAGNGLQHGVFIAPGDVCDGAIQGLGGIRNRFVAAAD